MDEERPRATNEEPASPDPRADGASESAAISALPDHPIGTLAIVLIFGLLFAVFWAWVYFGEFLGRGAPSP